MENKRKQTNTKKNKDQNKRTHRKKLKINKLTNAQKTILQKQKKTKN